MNDVKRQRTKQDEERVWTSFVQQQEQKCYDDCRVNCFHGITNPKQHYRDNLEEIDQELKRLEEDALPEQTKRLNDCETPRLINYKKQKDNLVNQIFHTVIYYLLNSIMLSQVYGFIKLF